MKEYDVIVCGSGPAGIGAALSAGRAGAKTLLIEKDGIVGGVATTGLMSHWTGTADSPLYKEIIARSCAEENRSLDENAKYINPELLKIMLLKMLQEAGVQIRLYTFVSGVILENAVVRGVKTTSKSGEESFYAHTVIDATGDGDVACFAGVPYEYGREGDHKAQPLTLMFKVGGVDYTKGTFLGSFETLFETEKGELQALGRKHLPFPAGHVLLYRSTIDGVVTCNMTNVINRDGTNAEDLTQAEIECRMQIPKIIEFLREYAAGYENCYLLSSASVIGVRETRHFQGRYTVTEQDVYDCVPFDDWVVKGAKFNFDIHNIDGAGLDKNGLQAKYVQKEGGYYLPLRALLPVGTEGLILAGRCISGTHVAHSNFRVMPICLAMGESAGAAAALAAKGKIFVSAVAAEDIRKLVFGNR
ncbi:MAG: pyridine nucleotide-disulfide oxidoreductase [Bacillota bacterium]|nr:MAG: pyridine nucleotide-disulfide oxidoreductase [Bacillota bacterium]